MFNYKSNGVKLSQNVIWNENVTHRLYMFIKIQFSEAFTSRASRIHSQNINVMLKKLLSLAAPEVVEMTNSGWMITKISSRWRDVHFIVRFIRSRNVLCHMMTSSNTNIFRVTGLCMGNPPVYRWIPLTKASDGNLWCFLWSAPEQTIEQTTETPVIWDAIAFIMASL